MSWSPCRIKGLPPLSEGKTWQNISKTLKSHYSVQMGWPTSFRLASCSYSRTVYAGESRCARPKAGWSLKDNALVEGKNLINASYFMGWDQECIVCAYVEKQDDMGKI